MHKIAWLAEKAAEVVEIAGIAEAVGKFYREETSLQQAQGFPSSLHLCRKAQQTTRMLLERVNILAIMRTIMNRKSLS